MNEYSEEDTVLVKKKEVVTLGYKHQWWHLAIYVVIFLVDILAIYFHHADGSEFIILGAVPINVFILFTPFGVLIEAFIRQICDAIKSLYLSSKGNSNKKKRRKYGT